MWPIKVTEHMALEQPLKGLAIGSLIFLVILVVVVIILAIAFRKGQTCYAINFATILIIMAYIMWACTYMCQMYPLVVPEYASDSE